jgi:hypothetical protein
VRDNGLLLPAATLSMLAALVTMTGCRSMSPAAADSRPGCATSAAACETACGAASGCGNTPQGLADRQSPYHTQCLGFGLLGPLYADPRLSQGTACWPWQYMYNVTLAGSQFSNAVLGGDPDESLSSRLGRAERDGVAPVKYVVYPAADLLIGPSHCWGSIEEDESRRMELWGW